MAPRSPVVQRNDAITASSHTPASLLWGHQLKREHAFLLERMKKLEAEHHTFASRIVAAEAAAEAMSAAVDDVQRLTEEENSVDDARRAWIASAEERLGKLEDASEKARNLQVRIAELEARPTEFDGIEERLRRVEEEHRSVLPNQSVIQKLRAHDTELQALRRDIRRPSKSFSPTDIPVLKQRMEAVESRLDSGRNEEQKVRAMEIKIATLEKTCRAYNDKITELEARLHNSNVTRDYPLPSTEVPTQLLPSSYAADTQTLAVADPTIEVPTQILPSSNTEVPTQILPSSNTEVPTQILPSSNVTDVQVPASPPLGLRKEKDPRAVREETQESPSFQAQRRKSNQGTKTARAKARAPQRHAQVLKTQMETQDASQTPDLDAPYTHAHAPNSARKRKAVLPYERPQTRSQAKSKLGQVQNAAELKPSRIVVLKTGLSRSARPSGVIKRSQSPQRDSKGRFVKKQRPVKSAPVARKRETARQKLAKNGKMASRR